MDHTAPSWASSASIRLPEARSYSCSFPVWGKRHHRGRISLCSQLMIASGRRAPCHPCPQQPASSGGCYTQMAKLLISIRSSQSSPLLSTSSHKSSIMTLRTQQCSRSGEAIHFLWGCLNDIFLTHSHTWAVWGQRATPYLGPNDDLPISGDEERAERVLTLHCPDALQGRPVDRAQNLLPHTESGLLSETSSSVASTYSCLSTGVKR